MEMKRADMAKPYDPKRSIWVPDSGPEGGFVEALLESEAGGKTVAMVGHEVSVKQMDSRTIGQFGSWINSFIAGHLESFIVGEFGSSAVWKLGCNKVGQLTS